MTLVRIAKTLFALTLPQILGAARTDRLTLGALTRRHCKKAILFRWVSVPSVGSLTKIAFILFILPLVLTACPVAEQRYEPPPPAPPAPPPPPAITENYTVVPVFFGTDRAHVGTGNAASQYNPVKNHQFSYGYANVSIPAVHRLGEIERPQLLRLEFREDPQKHIVIGDIMLVDKATFFQDVKSRVNESEPKRAFVFIHGFNVPFDDALRRTAQIKYDLKYPGPAILFSWPSFGEVLKYPYDLGNAAWAVPDLENFLLNVAARSGATQIDMIAHSMGNQALIAALQDIAIKNQPIRFREIVLAAPDIDAEIFARAVPAIMGKRPA